VTRSASVSPSQVPRAGSGGFEPIVSNQYQVTVFVAGSQPKTECPSNDTFPSFSST